MEHARIKCRIYRDNGYSRLYIVACYEMKMAKMVVYLIKIIVTEGSRFIGTNLIEYLVKQGYQIINIDIAFPKIEKRRILGGRLRRRKHRSI